MTAFRVRTNRPERYGKQSERLFAAFRGRYAKNESAKRIHVCAQQSDFEPGGKVRSDFAHASSGN